MFLCTNNKNTNKIKFAATGIFLSQLKIYKTPGLCVGRNFKDITLDFWNSVSNA